MQNQNTSPSQTKFCSACGQAVSATARFCPGCGSDQRSQPTPPPAPTPLLSTGNDQRAMILSANQIFCRGCGQPLHKTAPYCPHCGAPQASSSYGLGSLSEGGGRSKIVAAVLAFTLGGFGAHKFYLGQIGLGILYLVFFWTFIPAIVAFIEFIIYLSMSDEEFARKYG